MEHEDADEDVVADEPQPHAHGCVQRLTIAILLAALYLIAFWAGVAWLIYWLVTRL